WIEEEMRIRAARPEKIRREDVFWAISTDRLTGDAAGYGQAVPLLHPSHDALRMMWHAAVGPLAAPLTPVFLGMTGVPDEYAQHRYLTQGEAHRFLDLRKEKENPDTVSHVEQGIEVADSAVYQFKRLMHLIFQDNSLMGEVSDHWRRMEADLADDLPNALRSAELLLEAGEPDLAARLLTNESHRWLDIGLEDCNAIVSSAHARLRRAGRLNRTKRPHTPEQI
ncbi:MAG: dipeptidase, partial [Maritimibacter sp.]